MLGGDFAKQEPPSNACQKVVDCNCARIQYRNWMKRARSATPKDTMFVLHVAALIVESIGKHLILSTSIVAGLAIVFGSRRSTKHPSMIPAALAMIFCEAALSQSISVTDRGQAMGVPTVIIFGVMPWPEISMV